MYYLWCCLRRLLGDLKAMLHYQVNDFCDFLGRSRSPTLEFPASVESLSPLAPSLHIDPMHCPFVCLWK
jgi:hypothetical protein